MSDTDLTEGQPLKQPFPTNRIVAFLGPHIAWLAGLIATWLVAHFPGLDINGGKAAEVIAQVLTFVIVTGVTWAGQQKWMNGWQAWEQRLDLIKMQQDQQAQMGKPNIVGELKGTNKLAAPTVGEPIEDEDVDQDISPAEMQMMTSGHPDGDSYDPTQFQPEGAITGKHIQDDAP